MKQHNNIMDKKNQREIIELEISVLILTLDTTYDYNNEFWDSIELFYFIVMSN